MYFFMFVILGITEFSLFVIRDFSFTLMPYIVVSSCMVFTYCLFMLVLCIDVLRVFLRFLKSITAYKILSSNQTININTPIVS